MYVDILKENLIKGISKTTRLISSSSQLPILSNILITAQKNTLILQSTNLETSLMITLGAKVEEQGQYTVPARLFSEFISPLPAEKITLKLEGSKLSISCKNHQASINGLPPDDFPSFPTHQKKPFLSLDSQTFSNIISSVALSSTSDDTRPVLNGVLFDFNGSTLILVATDGYRLSSHSLSEVKGEFQNMIVPAKSLLEVQKNISDQQKDQSLEFFQTEDKNQIVFQHQDILLSTRLIDGQFPDYQKIIPAESTTQIEIDTKDLLQAIKLSSVFARENANIVTFSLKDQLLSISSQSPQLGENKNDLHVKKQGEDLRIAFNSRYLLELLNCYHEDTLNVELSGPLAPAVMKNPNNPSFLHLIMPVRLQS